MRELRVKLDDDLLMAPDVYDEGFGPVEGMYVMYSTKDVDRARTVFEGLSEGGEVVTAGGEVCWSPYFGVCRDRFGTPWQISAELSDAGAGVA